MANIFEKNKQEIEKLVKEAYDNASKAPKTGDIFKDNRAVYEETTMNEILKSYDGKYGVDFQRELKAYLEPTTLERVRASIDGKDIDLEKKKEQKELSKDINDAKKEGAQIDSDTEKKIEENVEEKQKSNDSIDIKSEVLKASYETTLEEYHKLRQRLQEGKKGKLETGELVSNEKMEVKLVLYEKYLKNLDMHYKSKNGQFIVKDDEDIQKKETELAYKSTRNDRIVKGKFQDNVTDISKLNGERASIAEDIAALSGKAKIMDGEKFKEQMDILQKEYIEKTVEISSINPNPAELYKDIEERNEIDDFNYRSIGTQYNKKLEHPGEDKKNQMQDKKIDKEMSETTQEVEQTTNEALDALITAYEEAEDRGDYKKAEELLQSIETVTGISETESKAEKNDGEQKDNINDEVEQQEKEKKTNGFFDPRLAAVNDEEKLSEIDAGKEDREKRYNEALKDANYTRKQAQEKEGPELSRRNSYHN